MKILMVCLGNICRSPLAHGILAHLAERKGLDWDIDSAGTGDWHVGQGPDKRSVSVAKKYGVDISAQAARQFSVADFDRYDHILVMDRMNLRDVLEQADKEADREKVQLFLNNNEVPDPYYDNGQFDPVYQMIERRCHELIEQWA